MIWRMKLSLLMDFRCFEPIVLYWFEIMMIRQSPAWKRLREWLSVWCKNTRLKRWLVMLSIRRYIFWVDLGQCLSVAWITPGTTATELREFHNKLLNSHLGNSCFILGDDFCRFDTTLSLSSLVRFPSRDRHLFRFGLFVVQWHA